MTFNAASRLRSLKDRSAALGSRRCELPGMHSVPTSAVLPYASGVGGLSRRLLNNSPTTWGLYWVADLEKAPEHQDSRIEVMSFLPSEGDCEKAPFLCKVHACHALLGLGFMFCV